MPRVQTSLGRSVGRLSGQSITAIARKRTECRVEGCVFINRNDKVKAHQRKLVLWDSEGIPVDKNHDKYKHLNDNQKLHTDWFRSNGFTSTRMPLNKTVTAAKKGTLDTYFGVGGEANHNRPDKAAQSDPDDPDSGSDMEGQNNDENFNLLTDNEENLSEENDENLLEENEDNLFEDNEENNNIAIDIMEGEAELVTENVKGSANVGLGGDNGSASYQIPELNEAGYQNLVRKICFKNLEFIQIQ